MPASRPECVTESELAQVADGQPLPPDLAEHAQGCPVCRDRLDDALADAAFLTRVRRLRGSGQNRGIPILTGYRILHEISSGAQGVVYRAVQEATARPVAIKLLQTGDGATAHQRLRAQREAEIAAHLNHPNIVTVYESRGLHDGRIVIVMEYVDGVPIDQWQPPGDTPQARQRAILGAFITIAQAVHHAHLNGVIHRDLKPDNILVTHTGRPVVLDFGIARLGNTSTTATGEFAGTPAYASPEQVSGEPDRVDALTDVYSLGVMLYRLLCGTMPYELDGSLFDIARTIMEVEPVPPRSRDASIHPDLDAVVRRSLDKSKHRRYQSAASLARDIQRYISGEPVDARSGSGWYLMRKAISANRGRLVQITIGVALLIGAGGVVGVSVYRQGKAEQLVAARTREAYSENVRARAVSEFLGETFPASGPARRDLEWSVGAGLNRLYYRIETGDFAAEPDLELALRRLWSGVYTKLNTGQGVTMVPYAEISLRNGLVKLRQQHGERHPDIASGLHELASLLLVRGRLQEAHQVATEALNMRTALHGSQSLPTADSAMLMASILVERGELDSGLEFATQAERVYRSQPIARVRLALGRLRMLQTRVAVEQNRLSDAQGLLMESLAMLFSQLPHDSAEVILALEQLADLAEKMPEADWILPLATARGEAPEDFAASLRDDLFKFVPNEMESQSRFSETTAALDRMVNLQSQILGPSDPSLVRTLLSVMSAARIEHEYEFHFAAAIRAAEILAEQPDHGDQTAIVCLEEAAVTLAVSGRALQAVELANQAQSIRERVPAYARDLLIEANAKRNLAWFMTLAGQCEQAIPIWTKVGMDIREAYGSKHHVAALADCGLAYCLAEKGSLDEAMVLADSSYETVMAMPFAAVDQVGVVSFVKGHILKMAGRHSEALTLFDAAWDASFGLIHPAHKWRRELITDALASSLAMHNLVAAEQWQQRGEWVEADGRSRDD